MNILTWSETDNSHEYTQITDWDVMQSEDEDVALAIINALRTTGYAQVGGGASVRFEYCAF